MPRTITYDSLATISVEHDGQVRRGLVVLRASNGALEPVTIAGAGADVDFSTLGTAAQRTAFLAICSAAVAAARAKVGDV